jgi:hypothetical protein
LEEKFPISKMPSQSAPSPFQTEMGATISHTVNLKVSQQIENTQQTFQLSLHCPVIAFHSYFRFPHSSSYLLVWLNGAMKSWLLPKGTGMNWLNISNW